VKTILKNLEGLKNDLRGSAPIKSTVTKKSAGSVFESGVVMNIVDGGSNTRRCSMRR